jgi:hypothetical protein
MRSWRFETAYTCFLHRKSHVDHAAMMNAVTNVRVVQELGVPGNACWMVIAALLMSKIVMSASLSSPVRLRLLYHKVVVRTGVGQLQSG